VKPVATRPAGAKQALPQVLLRVALAARPLDDAREQRIAWFQELPMRARRCLGPPFKKQGTTCARSSPPPELFVPGIPDVVVESMRTVIAPHASGTPGKSVPIGSVNESLPSCASATIAEPVNCLDADAISKRVRAVHGRSPFGSSGA
jgi:hypothetical protein